MTPRQIAKCGKSLALRIQRKSADASRRGKLGVQARRAKMAAQAQTVEYVGTVRFIAAGGKVRQVILRSDGETVCVDGAARRTYRAFCEAMNRKIWRAVK